MNKYTKKQIGRAFCAFYAIFAVQTTIIMLLTLLLSFLAICQPDISQLNQKNHPCVLATESDFQALETSLAGRPDGADVKMLTLMHESVITKADSFVKAAKLPKYKKDVSGRRILTVSRNALMQIFDCAYAYRSSGERKYLDYAESVINAVCAFPDWNPSHYLDVAEMGLAVAIGYDWLYADLRPETRSNAESAMYRFSVRTCIDGEGTSYLKGHSNWNQVCNAGTAAVAIALYKLYPEESEFIIRRAIESNYNGIKEMYAPDGIYPEGYGYWQYGTDFQIVMNLLLEKAFGTDCGLSDVPGFDRTGRFYMFGQGNTGRKFDFSDTGDAGSDFYECWYFARRFNDPSVLSLYYARHPEGKGISASSRLAPLFVLQAAGCSLRPVENNDKMFSGNGMIPVFVARTGWDRDDLYLAAKGGFAAQNHGHMDAGSFIYEKGGVRWASEVHSGVSYAPIEKAMKETGSVGLWKMTQESCRWKVFSYGNREHNTLTINDKDHLVKGNATLLATVCNESEKGGTLDLTPLFGNDVQSATRKIVIKDDSFLEITDVITSAADKAADVRFTLVTDALPEVGRKSIILTSDGQAAEFKVVGVKVRYAIWPSNPAEYPFPVNKALKQTEKNLCGYTYTVPAGKTVTVVTRISTPAR